MSPQAFYRLVFGFYALIALAVIASCAGCGSEYASPFDKPDKTIEPVACSASSPCAQ